MVESNKTMPSFDAPFNYRAKLERSNNISTP